MKIAAITREGKVRSETAVTPTNQSADQSAVDKF